MKTKTQQTLEQMLFARLKKTGGKYRARTSIDGARTRLTIEASSKRNAATAAANAITERAAARKNPKLADILAVYKTLAAANNSGASLKPATAHKNAQSLMLILRAAKLDALTITLSELTPQIVETWRRYCYQKAGLNWNIPNPDKNTSLNSTWRQAKSVFSRRALEAYARAGYTIPQNAIDFAETPELTPTKKLGFSPIDEETDATLKRLSALALDGKRGQGIPAPDVAAMYQMARFAGMTLNEIKHFRPSWIVRRRGATYINVAEDGAFTTKRGTKNRQIPVDRDRLDKWLAAIKNTDFEAAQTYKRANEWLKAYLPDRTKKLHEMRKMACSEMLERTGNIFLASKFIGNSVNTTTKYYANLLTAIKPL
ncbi:hypothetical protein P3B99_004980 [Opitutia bacterium KCR 482]|nr:hypothetical protein [Opitutae bacterium KCR 482]